MAGTSTSSAVEYPDAQLIITQTGDNEWSFAIDNAPAFNENGDDWAYYIVEGSMKLPSGDHYSPYVRNVDNYSNETTGLFKNGTLTNTLCGSTSYTTTKTWLDGNNVTGRPNCTLFLYRAIEELDENGNYVVDLEKISPVQGYDQASVPKVDGDIVMGQEEGYDALPKYDLMGNKYVYFTLEKGVNAPYTKIVDNSTSGEKDSIKQVFSDGKYALNGSQLTNKRTGTTSAESTKIFKAQSMQSMVDTKVQFTLQTKGVADESWKTYTDASGNSVTTVVDGFCAEVPTKDFAIGDGTTLPSYDEEGYEVSYRWIETGMWVNGATEMTPVQVVDASAEEPQYQTANVGLVGPGALGGTEPTTAFFEPSYDPQTNVTTNLLVGNIEVKATKEWYVGGYKVTTDQYGNTYVNGEKYDMEGVGVVYSLTGTDGTSREITVYQDKSVIKIDDKITGEVDNTNPWEMIDLFNRYDENGAEITYTIEEIGVVDPQDRGWSYTEHYFKNGTDTVLGNVVVPLINGTFVNTLEGEGEALVFDIYKQWKDDLDLLSRRDCYAAIFKVDENGQVGDRVTEPVVLNASNCWYQRVTINKEGDATVADYVVKEVTAGGVAVSNESTNASDYRNGTTIVSVLEEADGEDHGLDYAYNVYTEGGGSGNHALYTVTNVRKGKLSLTFTKTWKVGEIDASNLPATFQLYKNGQPYGDPVTVTADQATTKSMDILSALANLFNPTSVQEAKSATYTFENLDKYDENGVMITYSIGEIAIAGVPVQNGSATVDGETYSVSQTDLAPYIADAAHHHNGDVYSYAVTNTRTDSYTLDINKVWRDDGTALNDTARPDINFNVYRISEKYFLEKDIEVNSANIAAAKSSATAIAIDAEWNTKHNDYWWSCDLGSQPRYDSDGYRYIYFAQEKYTTEQADYVAAYDNYYASEGVDSPVAPSGDIKTQDVLSRATADLETGGKIDGSGAIVILSTGYDVNGVEANQVYSRTVVNYRTDDRTISGRKLWKMQDDWAIPTSDMPQVKVSLYVSSEPIVDEATGKEAETVTKSQIEAYVSAGKATYVNNVTLNQNGDGNYYFSFDETADGQKLKRYNEWGQKYYYYVDDTVVSAVAAEEYPDDQVLITCNNFTIANTNVPTVPYVKVSFNKIWETYFQDKDSIAPATFTLWAKPTYNGEPIAEANTIAMATITVQPGDSGKAFYTFEHRDNGEQLPYYGPNGQPLTYWVTEGNNPDQSTAPTNGYAVKDTVSGMSITSPVQLEKQSETLYTGSVLGDIDNVYWGDKTTFDAVKTWANDDNLTDNKAYRPDKLYVSIMRTWADNTVNGVTLAGGTEYVNSIAGTETYGQHSDVAVWLDVTPTDTSSSQWKVSLEDLPKYANNGSEYRYYISDECTDSSNPTGSAVQFYTKTTSGNGIKNTLDETQLTATKTWKNAATDNNLTGAELQRAINAGAVPSGIYMVVQRTIDGSTWEYVQAKDSYNSSYKVAATDADVTAGFSNVVGYYKATDSTVSWSVTWKAANGVTLPKTDTNGNTYTYRVEEILKWADGSYSHYINDDTSSNQLKPADTTWKYNPDTASVAVSNNKYAFTDALDMTQARINKVWEDTYNVDGYRPDSIKVNVTLADGTKVAENMKMTRTKAANAGITDINTYSTGDFYVPTTIIKQAQYATVEITFKDKEGRDNTYTERVKTSDMVDGVYVFTHFNQTMLQRYTVNAEATKTFSGDDAWKSLTRPTVVFQLQASINGGDWTNVTEDNASDYWDTANTDLAGQSGKQTVVIGDDNTGKATWSKLYKNYNDTTKTTIQPIAYRVIETLVDDEGNALTNSSYMASNNGIANLELKRDTSTGTTYTGTGSITNYLQTATPSVIKKWNNSEDKSISNVSDLVSWGALPQSVTFALTGKVGDTTVVATQSRTFDTTTIVNETAWSKGTKIGDANDNYPKYDKNGNQISYTLTEASYKYADGTVIDPASDDANITPMDVTMSAAAGFDATVTNKLETTTRSVDKSWLDDNNRDGIRSGSVSIQLYRDGNAYGSAITLNSSNNWTYTWTNLPKHKAGTTEVESVYSLKEVEVPNNYTSNAAQAQTVSDKFTVENSHDPERITIPVEKVWSDDDNHDGKRPTEITINLLADGTQIASKTVTADADGNWSYTFESEKDGCPVLYKYRDQGTAIKYTVTEDTVADYTTKVEAKDSSDASKGFTVTNSRDNDVRQVTVTKIWSDNDDQDGIRATYGVTLYADGTAVGSEVKLGKDVDTYTWKDLPVYQKGGKEITYTVVETTVPEGYTASTATGAAVVDADGKVAVTNTHTPEVTERTVTKDWDDADDQDGIRGSYGVQLYADGTPVGQIVTLDKDTLTYTWTNLPKYREHGTEIVYTVDEVTVPTGYTKTVDGFKVTNHHTPETVETSIEKFWDDANNQDGIRASFGVTLYADGQAVGNEVTLDKDTLTYTWKDLPKYRDGGTEIKYTVAETTVPEGYTSDTPDQVDAVIGGSKTIKNSHSVEKTSVSVKKTWAGEKWAADSSELQLVRPMTLTYNLIGKITVDGEEVTVYTDTWSITPDNKTLAEGWNYTFDCPVNAPGYEGIQVNYTVEEKAVVNYDTETKDVSTDEQKAFLFTNTLKTVEVPATKAWADDDDRDGVRPESITFVLTGMLPTADDEPGAMSTDEGEGGEEGDNQGSGEGTDEGTDEWPEGAVIYETQVVTADDDWSCVFAGLPEMDADGNKIVYTVTERETVEGDLAAYDEAVIEGDAASGYTVTNPHEIQTLDIPVVKVWSDNDNLVKKRPTSVTVNLCADGEQIDSQVLSESNNWAYTFEDLPVYRDHGTKIEYTVEEANVPTDYEVEIAYAEDAEAGALNATVTNTFTGFETVVEGQKSWVDDEDASGERPESVTIALLQNGVKVTEKVVTAGEDGKWFYQFAGLPTEDDSGEMYEYTVEEVGDTGIYSGVVSGSDITNVHKSKVEETSVSGTKTWDDNGNAMGARPTSIKVGLYRNGALVDTATVSADANGNWTYDWEHLPQAKDSDGNDVFTYTVAEIDVPTNYVAAVNGYNLTNKYTGPTEDTSKKTTSSSSTTKTGDQTIPMAVGLGVMAVGSAGVLSVSAARRKKSQK